MKRLGLNSIYNWIPMQKKSNNQTLVGLTKATASYPTLSSIDESLSRNRCPMLSTG